MDVLAEVEASVLSGVCGLSCIPSLCSLVRPRTCLVGAVTDDLLDCCCAGFVNLDVSFFLELIAAVVLRFLIFSVDFSVDLSLAEV